MSDGKKKLSFLTVISTIICVVFVCEAAAPAAAIGNQQFFWFDSDTAVRIVEASGAEVTPAKDPTGRDRVVLRFVTSWACQPEHVEELLGFISAL